MNISSFLNALSFLSEDTKVHVEVKIENVSLSFDISTKDKDYDVLKELLQSVQS